MATRFLVELAPPDGGFEAIERIGARARAVASELVREGAPVRFLRSVFVPEDGSCFLLFEARTPEAARAAAARAALPVGRVAETVRLDTAAGNGHPPEPSETEE